MTWSFSKPHSPLWSPAAKRKHHLPRFFDSKTQSRLHQPNTFFLPTPLRLNGFLVATYLLVLGNGCTFWRHRRVQEELAKAYHWQEQDLWGALLTEAIGGCLPLGWEQMRFLIGPFRSFCYVLCGYQFSPCKKETWWAKWCFQRLWYPNLLQVIASESTC